MLMQTKRLMVSLVLVSGILGVRWARAQAAPEEKAAQRQAEIEQLRAQQEQIKAQLDVLQLEKQKLQSELEQRKADGVEAQNAAVYRRTVVQREQAIAQAKDEAAKEQQQQAWRKWNAERIVGDRAGQNEMPGRAQLDLVSLANSYVDAAGGVKLAEVRMQAMEEKQDRIGMRIEKVNLETAKRKVAIFRGIVEAAREAAQADLEIASQQVQNGIAPKGSMNEAKSRVKILEVILAQ